MTFSWIFHFLLKDFSKKILDLFSQMPDAGMWNYVKGQKRRKLNLGGFTASFADC